MSAVVVFVAVEPSKASVEETEAEDIYAASVVAAESLYNQEKASVFGLPFADPVLEDLSAP